MEHLKAFNEYGILEKMGISIDVDNMVKQMVSIILDNENMMETAEYIIKDYKDGDSDYRMHKSFLVEIDGSDIKSSEFKISSIILEVAFDVGSIHTMNMKHTGVFRADTFEVDEEKNATFVILCAVHSNVDEWKKSILDGTIKDDVGIQLSGVIEHEMTHAYESYKRYEHRLDLGDAKDSLYASTANMLRDALPEIIPDDKISKSISYFLFLMYYITSFEINAKVAETWPVLRGVKDPHKRLEIVKKTETWKHINDLRNFKASKFFENIKNILVLDYDYPEDMAERKVNDIIMNILRSLMRSEEEDIKGSFAKFILGGQSLEKRLAMHRTEFRSMSRSKDYKSFLYFWEKKFNKGGENMYRRISKLTTLDFDE